MSSSHPDNCNSTSIELSREQRDQSFRENYWSHAIRYGIQYYVAGRFAAASAFTPVLANLLHHAVELFLKACLAHEDSVELIRKYGTFNTGYGHDLPRLWTEFKKRNATAARPEFDRIIAALHRFEEIRYPEQLIDDGATIIINIFAVDDQPQDEHRPEEHEYLLSLPEVDELMGLLFTSTRCNRESFLAAVNDERRRLHYDTLTTSLFGLEVVKP